LIVNDDNEAQMAYDVASFLGKSATILPDIRISYMDDTRSFREEFYDLFVAISNQKQDDFLISPLRTILLNLPKKELYKKRSFSFGDFLKLDELKDELLYFGYSFVDIIELRGEVSFRGDIIDIFSLNAKSPIRISLFDDEIESIREFDVNSQRSFKDEIEQITIMPAMFGLQEEQYSKISLRVENFVSDDLANDFYSSAFWFLEELGEDYIKEYNPIFAYNLADEYNDIFAFSGFDSRGEELDKIEVLQEATHYKDIIKFVPNDLIEFHKSKKITIIARNEAMLKQHLRDDLGVAFSYKQSPVILNIISKDELIISLNQKIQNKKTKKPKIMIDALKIGDLVVHENYGVGKFTAIQKVKLLGSTRDFISISYQNDDKLLIPIENIYLIDRYVVGGGSLPMLDRLGKQTFLKLKEKVKKRLFEIASSIVNMAAARNLIKAKIITISRSDILEFQDGAGFAYTEDQTKTINEILSDLKSGKPMDRLLSGDVGFGKTEVAMNAMFMAFKNGMQCAMIVPTTLLCSQHYKEVKHRLSSFGANVAKLDRFVKAKDKTKVVEDLKNGIIDIVIGTHAIFGVEFDNLGIVIIDEEHKFGVKQKEHLKELSSKLHLLSMSATPIPRTLNQSLSKIKGISTLIIPPVDRVGVRTYVKDYNDKLVKEIFLREIRRDGQIFYVYNQIATIEAKKKELLGILPSIKILVLHSQVNNFTTEKEILAFEKKEYDVLLSTTIIESGIHMPNVNSIIIDGADRFGMADLHQLRGRVGRGSKEGFCYFLVKDKEILTKEATKRLLVLEKNSFLGSGSILAYHDLEIRGGGNLIGSDQSGHIKNIGYSLYLKMLEEAIGILSGTITHENRLEIDIKLEISAYISEDVIGEERIRLDLYRRLGSAQSVSDVYEIESEMLDRFGELDTPTKQFLNLIEIKTIALSKNIKQISSYNKFITITFDNEEKSRVESRSKDDDDIIRATLKYLRS
jgi:transcription-repair coupling factor (superfamily II helicase)